jgi:hypothetical protein
MVIRVPLAALLALGESTRVNGSGTSSMLHLPPTEPLLCVLEWTVLPSAMDHSLSDRRQRELWYDT